MKEINFFNFHRKAFRDWLVLNEIKPFRGDQLFKWIYAKNTLDLIEMTDLSKSDRKKILDKVDFQLTEVVEIKKSSDGSMKFLHRLSDGYLIESVLMEHESHLTICLSSQVGCAMGCTFCLTGTMGLRRNLEPHEIISQVLHAKQQIPEDGKELKNIVFMGMGEPLHNYKNLKISLAILCDEMGLAFSGRRITVSTSGLIKQIEQFVEESPKINLAVSLNASNEEFRSEIMPVNKRYPLERLIECIRSGSQKVRRRVTFEYILFDGLNNTPKHAKELIKLLNGMRIKINLIPYNPNPQLSFKRPEDDANYAFQKILLDAGLIVTVRYSKGLDIGAACGQLVTESSLDDK